MGRACDDLRCKFLYRRSVVLCLKNRKYYGGVSSLTTQKIRKLDFEHKLVANIKKDNKSFFAYIRSKQKVKYRVGPLKDIDGNVTTKSVDIAESLNNYFSSVFTLEDKGKLPTIPQMMGENEACIQHMVITPDMILAKLKKVKDNKSTGVGWNFAKGRSSPV